MEKCQIYYIERIETQKKKSHFNTRDYTFFISQCRQSLYQTVRRCPNSTALVLLLFLLIVLIFRLPVDESKQTKTSYIHHKMLAVGD